MHLQQTTIQGQHSGIRRARVPAAQAVKPTHGASCRHLVAPAQHVCCQQQGVLVAMRPRAVATFATKPGGSSVLDAPTTLPGYENSNETSEKKPPMYKVMLHNDNYNRREYVVKVLLKVVPGITVDDAVLAMQEAHETGVAMVIACNQDDAERYCEDLRLNGLTSTIEPGR